MIPEERHLRMLIESWERELNRHGWDNTPPVLALAGWDQEMHAMAMTPFPVQTTDIDADASYALQMIVESLDSERGLELITGLLKAMQDGPEIVGIVFSAEVWVTDKPSELREHRGIADTVGAWEARHVMAVDCGGRVYWCQRARGQDPESETWKPGDDDRGMSGPLVRHLVKLLQLVMQFAPAKDIDRTSMDALLKALG